MIADSSYTKTEIELRSYSQLEENWDGYDGIPPEDGVVVTALFFLDVLKNNQIPAPKSMLSGRGEIGLYWEHSIYGYMTVSFDEPMTLSYYLESPENDFSGDDDLPFGHDIEIRELPYLLFRKLLEFKDDKG